MSSNEKWLSLSEAAEKLGVHASTLRRWSDNGQIPVMITPGGHRRFNRADLERWAQQREPSRSQGSPAEMWASKALQTTRQGLTERSDTNWLPTKDEATRSQLRELGQRLMGLALQYIASDDNDDGILDEANAIGVAYANTSLKIDMPLADALRAFMFFRDMLVETAITLPETARSRQSTNRRILQRVNTLLNAVQLAIVEHYSESA